MNEAFRIYIIVPFFMDGGVERWVNQLCETLPKEKVTLVISGKIKYHEFLPKNINIKQVENKGIISFFYGEKLNANDVLITALTPSNLFGLCLKILFRCKLITSLHVTLKKQSFERTYKYYARKIIYNLIPLLSDNLITVSDGLKSELIFKRKVTTLYNPIINEKYLNLSRADFQERDNIVMACGRLSYQKGFERLIEAVYIVESEVKIDNLEVWIVGEGKLKSDLERLIRRKGLSDIIKIIPFNNNIFDYYERAKVFVLSSKYEGFGNVLAEALSAGCYCTSFDIPHGPREILDNGKYGDLVEDNDVEGLADSIKIGLLSSENIINKKEKKEHCLKFTTEKFRINLNNLIRS